MVAFKEVSAGHAPIKRPTHIHVYICYSYTMAASGLRVIHEWLRFYRARGRSPSGLLKRKPRVYYP